MKFDLKKMLATDRPRKKEKSYQPPGTTMRKVGAMALWAVIAFMAMMIWLLVNYSGNESTAAVEEKENVATGAAAADFAKTFATTYFTWTAEADGWEQRAEALAPMLASGLDPQAGLVTAEQKWHSAAEAANVVEVKATGDNQALITVQLQQTMSHPDEKKAEVNTRTLAVPVAYNGTYGVIELPSFTSAAASTDVQRSKMKGEPVEVETEKKILKFLPTFFQSYTTDTPDKLAYFLEDATVSRGLEGNLVFQKLQEAQVVQAGNEYLVKTHIILKDEKTGTGFQAAYELKVTEADGRFVVTKINEGIE